MKKILSIRDNPSISVYTYHAYINAIMQNEDHVNDILYSLSIHGFENYNWFFDGEDTELCVESTYQIIKTKKYSQNNEAFLMRDCYEVDELCIDIKKWTFTQGDSVFNVIFTDDDYRKCCKEDYSIVRIGIVKNSGLYYKVNKDYRYVPRLPAEDIEAIKVKKDNDNLKVYVKTVNGENLEIINEKLNNHARLCKLGINVNAGENQYYNWLFMNYIQTYYTEEDKSVCYNYYDLPERNFSHHTVNHFLLYRDETINTVEGFWGDILTYCKLNIEFGRYIQVVLNEFFIPNRAAYNREDFFHANLIYGIDEEKEEIYILGYNDKYKLSSSVISFEIFMKSVSLNYKDIIRSIEYNPNNKKCCFDLKTFLHQLECYLASKNPTEYENNILPQEQGFYGIHIYSKFLNTELGRKRLFTDARIAFMINEKFQLMKERINFLFHRKYVNEKDYEILMGKITILLKMSSKMKLYVIKNRVKESQISENAIEKYMQQIYVEEYDFIRSLILCLKSC